MSLHSIEQVVLPSCEAPLGDGTTTSISVTRITDVGASGRRWHPILKPDHDMVMVTEVCLSKELKVLFAIR